MHSKKSWVGIVLFLTHVALAWLVILNLLSPEASDWGGTGFCLIILGLIDLAWCWSEWSENRREEQMHLRRQAQRRLELLQNSPLDAGNSINTAS